MHWNYRITKQSFGEDDLYAMREVYYSDAGDVVSWTRDEIGPCGETLEEITESHRRIGEAFSREVLDIGEWEPT